MCFYTQCSFNFLRVHQETSITRYRNNTAILKGKLGAAFGSYGWSGEAVKDVEKYLEDMKIPLAAESLRVVYVPSDEDLLKAREMGVRVGKELKERLGK